MIEQLIRRFETHEEFGQWRRAWQGWDATNYRAGEWMVPGVAAAGTPTRPATAEDWDGIDTSTFFVHNHEFGDEPRPEDLNAWEAWPEPDQFPVWVSFHAQHE